MRRIESARSILPLIMAVAVTLWGQAILASAGSDDESNEVQVNTEEKIKVVVVDDDGNRHEDVFVFDDDHPRPFLGIRLTEAPDGGVLVEGVVEDSAAERAGLQAGDIIVAIDGTDVDAPWNLTRAVLDRQVGDRVDLDLLRDGDRMGISAELGERQGVAEFGLQMEELEKHMDRLGDHLELLELRAEHGEGHPNVRIHRAHRPKLGVQLVRVTAELREHLGASADAGVLVSKVLPDMPAADGGILVGDLIVGVNGEPVRDAGDLVGALRDIDGQTIELEVIRDGRSRSFDVAIPPTDED